MKFKRKLYPRKNHGVIKSSGRKEIDLRTNFQSILFGDGETFTSCKASAIKSIQIR